MKSLRIFTCLIIAVVCSFLIGCGGGSSHKSTTTTTAPSGQNVAPIVVNSGPANNYVNGAFATVTVCAPGTSTCQTISGILVDTGSIGLRVLSSALTISLPQENSGNNPVVECVQFLDSYTWGPVQMADIQISGEKASSVPIQVLSDTDFKVPSSSCTSSGVSGDTLANLGANGILGVGLFAQDCGGPSCPTTANQYYACSSSSACTAISLPVAQQVQNPVTLFATDNNGVILELPAVSAPEASVSGSLIFGIGTQSNNGLSGATVYTTDSSGDFTTNFNGQSYTSSFIDSGSNAYFFPDSSIPACAKNTGASGFYCPSSTLNLSATNQGTNNASGPVNFSIANAVSLFSNSGDFVFGNLGGPGSNSFDWGLPFFYGRNVYTAIEGTTAPGGTTPYWAY